MFERFTSRARHAVVLAQLEARQRGHNYIGTEHLFLALVRAPDTVAGEALASAGITLEAARQRVLHTVGEGWSTHDGHIHSLPVPNVHWNCRSAKPPVSATTTSGPGTCC